MRTIPLTQGQVALVDDEDYEWLNQWNWYAIKNGNTFYAARTSPSPSPFVILMHHEIIGKPEPGLQTDHIDGNGFSNQKSNLRMVTKSQNQMNQHHTTGSSRFKGVGWNSRDNKWQAHIRIDGKSKHLGYFVLEEDAARAYDNAAVKYFGEYARLNFPQGER